MSARAAARPRGVAGGVLPLAMLALWIALDGREAGATETRRVAVLVGNNQGSTTQPPLRYAEDDVAKVAGVLSEIGGFNQTDVHLLTGRSLIEVRAALAQAKAVISAVRGRSGRTVLLFYFSGHSDGEGLEIGKERWSFSDVRATLKAIGSDIRIAIVDSCQSGALLAAKGGTPGPTFDIRFTDDLATSGEAVLTSSAAHERALESREIHASFFSHHLVSGLRGAADSSGDGRVTLGEAYRYAFVNTLLATSNTLTGPQHPAYDFRLSGQGELVLTEVVARGATLTLPRGFDRILVADEKRRHLLAELTSTSANRIALSAGNYVVQARRGDSAFEAIVTLAQGAQRVLAPDDLLPGASTSSVIKGGDGGGGGGVAAAVRRGFIPAGPPAGDPAEPRWRLAIAAGVTRGAAVALPFIPSVQVALESLGRAGWGLQLELASGRATGFRESAAYLGLGGWAARARGRWRATAGWRLAAGAVMQDIEGPATTHWTLAAATGPWVSGEVSFTDRLALILGAGIDLRLMRGDVPLLSAWPRLGLGLAIRL